MLPVDFHHGDAGRPAESGRLQVISPIACSILLSISSEARVFLDVETLVGTCPSITGHS